MKIGYLNSGDHPLYITKEHIERLSETMKKFVCYEGESESNYYWDVQLSNNQTFKEITTEQVLGLPNGSGSKIEELIIFGMEHSKSHASNSAYVRLMGESRDINTWYANADGKERDINLFRKEVEEIFRDMKPWWSLLKKIYFFGNSRYFRIYILFLNGA